MGRKDPLSSWLSSHVPRPPLGGGYLVTVCVPVYVCVCVWSKQWESDNDNAYSIMSLSTFMLAKCKNLQSAEEWQAGTDSKLAKHIHAFYNAAKARRTKVLGCEQ